MYVLKCVAVCCSALQPLSFSLSLSLYLSPSRSLSRTISLSLCFFTNSITHSLTHSLTGTGPAWTCANKAVKQPDPKGVETLIEPRIRPLCRTLFGFYSQSLRSVCGTSLWIVCGWRTIQVLLHACAVCEWGWVRCF